MINWTFTVILVGAIIWVFWHTWNMDENMLKPVLRSKPRLPVEPRKRILPGETVNCDCRLHCREIHIPHDYEYMDEEERSYYGPQCVSFPEELSYLTLDQVEVEVSSDDDGHLNVKAKLLVEIDNPFYDNEMKRYLTNMKYYKMDLENWHKEKKKYDQKMVKYKEARIAELEEEKRALEDEHS